MKHFKFIVIALFAALFVASCGSREIKVENRAVVSIAPLKPLVEGILGNDFEVTVLVPKAASRGRVSSFCVWNRTPRI